MGQETALSFIPQLYDCWDSRAFHEDRPGGRGFKHRASRQRNCIRSAPHSSRARDVRRMAVPLRVRTMLIRFSKVHEAQTVQREAAPHSLLLLRHRFLHGLVLHLLGLWSGLVLPLAFALPRRTRWLCSLGPDSSSNLLCWNDSRKSFALRLCIQHLRERFLGQVQG